jgi:hypothetical protein
MLASSTETADIMRVESASMASAKAASSDSAKRMASTAELSITITRVLARQTDFVVAQDLFWAPRVEIRKRGAAAADLEQLIARSRHGPLPLLPCQLLAQRDGYSVGDRKAGASGQLPREVLGLPVLDVRPPRCNLPSS